jgi:RNA polymerase sigma-70 factor (ECF subfamily)
VGGDEIELVRQAQRGDQEAFGRLMRLNIRAVYAFACRFMPAREDVDDVVQEVFLKAFQGLPRFDPGRRRLKSWLLRITANTSIDILRRRRSARAYVGRAMAQAVPDPEPAGLSGEFYHNSEVLKSALLALPTRERKAVVLFFYHDLTHREISDVLEIPLGTVKSRLRSAVRRLREDLLR